MLAWPTLPLPLPLDPPWERGNEFLVNNLAGSIFPPIEKTCSALLFLNYVVPTKSGWPTWKKSRKLNRPMAFSKRLKEQPGAMANMQEMQAVFPFSRIFWNGLIRLTASVDHSVTSLELFPIKTLKRRCWYLGNARQGYCTPYSTKSKKTPLQSIRKATKSSLM